MRRPLYRRPSNRSRDEVFERIAGLPSVEALFRVDPKRVERLYFEASMLKMIEPLQRVLAKAHKLYRQVGPEELVRLSGTDMHGGIVAFARPRAVRPIRVEDFAALGAKRVGLLMLDGVSNPQNIGAICRTAAFFGVRHLLVSDHPAQAGVSDAAYRIAKGGLEHVEVRQVNDTAATLTAIRSHYRVIATALSGGVDLAAATSTAGARDRRPPLLVLGNEEHGLPPETLAAAEIVVHLGARGAAVQSLNVSVTAGILIHALLG
jgi:TrmH RNA methyltransferase